MQSDQNETYSDLERARALSRNLRSPQKSSGDVMNSLSAFRAKARGGTAKEEPKSCIEVPPEKTTIVDDNVDELMLAVLERGNLGSRFWNDLLVQCLELADPQGGQAAFAVDEQGLGIAQVGEIEEDELEGTGSRLVIALEQAARMESFHGRRPASILIEFGNQWLTGLSVQCTPDTHVVVGFIARDPLPSRTRQLLSNLIGEGLFRS